MQKLVGWRCANCAGEDFTLLEKKNRWTGWRCTNCGRNLYIYAPPPEPAPELEALPAPEPVSEWQMSLLHE